MKTPEEFAESIFEVAEEETNAYYVSEILERTPKKYAFLRNCFALAILDFARGLGVDGFPGKEIAALLRKKLDEAKNSFDSPEIINALIETYRSEVEKFDSRRIGDSEENDKIRDYIHGLNKQELRIAVARAKGIEIVDYHWPCGKIENGFGLDAVIDVKRTGDGWVAAFEHDIEAYNLQYPVTRLTPSGWPPQEIKRSCSSEENRFEAFVEPIPNYSGDLLAAMSLISEMKGEGFKHTTRESLVNLEYYCYLEKDKPIGIKEIMSARSIPEAICKTYLVTLLLHVNPDAKKRVLPN